MIKRKFSLLGILLLAALLFSAEATLAADPEVRFFNNPWPTLDGGFNTCTSNFYVRRGKSAFVGMYVTPTDSFGPNDTATITIDLFNYQFPHGRRDIAIPGLKIKDMNGVQLQYSQRNDMPPPFIRLEIPNIKPMRPGVDVPQENVNYVQFYLEAEHSDLIYMLAPIVDVNNNAEEGRAMGTNTLLTLQSAGDDEAIALPVIDSNAPVTVEQGGMGTATFSGKNTEAWYYKPSDIENKGIESLTLVPKSNGRICNATVKLASDVKEGSIIEVPVYAMGKYGDTDDKKLVIRVAPDENHKTPTIDSGNKTLEIVAGGTASATFSGQHIKNWDYDKNNLPSFISGIDIKKNDNPNTGEVVVNVKDAANAVGQEGDIKIYAYNGAGKAVATPANLHVKVTAGDKYATPTIDGNETVTVIQGGTVTATFTGQHTRLWSVIPATSVDIYAFYTELDYFQDPARCDIKITANENAEDGTYRANVYAFNPAGQISLPKTLTVNIQKNAAHETATIDDDEEVSVAYGGSAMAVFTGSHVRTWYYNDEEGLPEWINAIEFDYSKNPDTCKITVTAMSDTSVTAGTTADIEIYAYNGVGQRSASKTLTVTLVNDEAHEPPVIEDDESVTVVKGGTSKAVFTGKHVRSWGYGTLPDAVKAVDLDFDSNPDRCEVSVTASSIAEVGDYELTVYAYNAVGVRTEATLNVTITDDPSHPDPVIYDEELSVKVIHGGTARAVFTGEHISSWRCINLPDEVKSVKLDYKDHPNRCEVLVTTSSNALPSDIPAQVYLYAFNDIGMNTSAVLNVTVTEDTSHPDPEIDEDESVTVIAGGTAKAVFTGEHIRSWKYGNLPDEVKALELDYSVNPDRCEVLVTASSTATAGNTSVTIYAYNEIGESTSKTLNITIVTDGAEYPNPEIDEDESVTVIAGGTAKAVFTGQHIRSWKCIDFPDAIKAIELKYDVNPDRCEVSVTASSSATAGDHEIYIYAFNEIGEDANAKLNVKIVADGTTYPDPVIDDEGSLSVVPGGTSNTIFTGQNVASWAYGSLPDSVKAIELRYDRNPNRCEVIVTASSTAEIDTDCTVTMYAYNEVGESADKNLNIFIEDPNSDSAVEPEIVTKIASADIIAGGSAALVFTAKNVTYWRHNGDLPSIVKAVEFNYDPDNAEQCEVVITTSSPANEGDSATNSTAKEGDSAKLTILAGNVYDEVGIDITVTIASKYSVAEPVINETTASLTVAPGGSAKTTFTGTNINTWKYGNLPNGISAFEIVYDTDNPNTCEVTVTASSTATTEDGGKIVITAYNSVGASAEATLTVVIGEDSGSSDQFPFLHRSSSGCDMGFSGLGILALAMMFFTKARSKN